jgi:hypothetical protein
MRSPQGKYRKSLNFEKSLGERTEKKLTSNNLCISHPNQENEREVKGTAGMSWGGQDGKLKQVFGQIVDDKQGEGAWSAGVKEDGFMGMRDDDITYEA